MQSETVELIQLLGLNYFDEEYRSEPIVEVKPLWILALEAISKRNIAVERKLWDMIGENKIESDYINRVIEHFRKRKDLHIDWWISVFPKDLIFLNLNSCFLSTRNSFIYLSKLNELKYLDLCNTDTRDEDIEYLLDLQSLVGLNISENGISDQSLTHIQKFKYLKWLNIRQTNCTLQGCLSLTGMPHLQVLIVNSEIENKILDFNYSKLNNIRIDDKLKVEQISLLLRSLGVTPSGKNKQVLKQQLKSIYAQKLVTSKIVSKVHPDRSVSDLASFYKTEIINGNTPAILDRKNSRSDLVKGVVSEHKKKIVERKSLELEPNSEKFKSVEQELLLVNEIESSLKEKKSFERIATETKVVELNSVVEPNLVEPMSCDIKEVLELNESEESTVEYEQNIVENAEQNPVEKAELNPVENAEQNPVENAEQNPVENAEQNPVENTEENTVKNAEQNTVENNESETPTVEQPIKSNIEDTNPIRTPRQRKKTVKNKKSKERESLPSQKHHTPKRKSSRTKKLSKSESHKLLTTSVAEEKPKKRTSTDLSKSRKQKSTEQQSDSSKTVDTTSPKKRKRKEKSVPKTENKKLKLTQTRITDFFTTHIYYNHSL
jgi:hypothetical protein